MSDNVIAKLQEAQMFTDRRTEELHESLLQLANQLDSVTSRIAALEARVESLIEATLPVEPELGDAEAAEFQ